jgi:hypothetical protein
MDIGRYPSDFPSLRSHSRVDFALAFAQASIVTATSAGRRTPMMTRV